MPSLPPSRVRFDASVRALAAGARSCGAYDLGKTPVETPVAFDDLGKPTVETAVRAQLRQTSLDTS